jgi:hypothetical protein
MSRIAETYAAPITKTSRAVSTTSRVTALNPLISSMRPTCASSRCIKRKFPAVILGWLGYAW